MIKELIDKAMSIISDYCISDCNADCCKSGKTLKEIGIRLNPCKYLKNDKCSIHNERPVTCRNYPIRSEMLGEKKIVIIGKCRAVDNGIIDNQIKEIEKLNYKIYK